MDPELLELRKRLEAARMAHQSAMLMNVGGTVEAMIEKDLILRRADQELIEAMLAYRHALDKEVRNREDQTPYIATTTEPGE